MSLITGNRESATEFIHGVKVYDPYRWLEDRTSTFTDEWIKEQKMRHNAYFELLPELGYLRSEVGAYLNVETIDQLVRTPCRLFYRRRQKDEEQACICARDILTGEVLTLVDPRALGKFVSVSIHSLSTDGSLLAFERRDGGSDSRTLHIIRTAAGSTLSCELDTRCIRTFAFAPNNAGFYYTQDTVSPSNSHTARLHLFASGAEDSIIFRAEKEIGSRLSVIADDSHVGVIYVSEENGQLLSNFYLADHELEPQWKLLLNGSSSPCLPILGASRVFLYSEQGAPNGKISELNKDGSEFKVIVPEDKLPIRQFIFALGRFWVAYDLNGTTIVHAWSVEDCGTHESATAAHFPEGGTIQFLSSFCRAPHSLFYSHETFTKPRQIFECLDPGIEHVTACSSHPGSQSDDYRVEPVQFRSKDGTEIPMSLVMHNSIDLSEPHAVILTAYGGFGVSMTPKFSVLVNILLRFNIIFALPNIRGGAEFGKAWHEAARARNRQVAIDDFLAAAQWLVDAKITTRERLGIFGGSNSGLLVAAAMTQQPGLFRAVLCIAPLLDMVRYERFDGASKWKREYGTVEDRDDFAALYAYSPYHHIENTVNYPATLFVSGDKDDRCNPLHARKTAARLQARDAQLYSILIDYSEERGHYPTLPLSTRIEALARRIAFLSHELGISIPKVGAACTGF